MRVRVCVEGWSIRFEGVISRWAIFRAWRDERAYSDEK